MSDEFKSLKFKNAADAITGELMAEAANFYLGGSGAEGDISLRDDKGMQTVHLDGGDANLTLGGPGHNGDIGLLSDDQKLRIHIDGGAANLYMGGEGAGGDIALKHHGGETTVHIDGGSGNITLGGGGSQGDVALVNGDRQQTVHIDGGNGNITLGGGGSEGDVALRNTEGGQTVHIDGGNGNITLGGAGSQGDIALVDPAGKQTIHLDGGEGVIKVNGHAVATADHVFTEGYDLKPLSDVAAFIASEGHLPGVASASQMRRDGVDLIAMNAKLLEKVEELTLYILDQERRLKALETKAEQLGFRSASSLCVPIMPAVLAFDWRSLIGRVDAPLAPPPVNRTLAVRNDTELKARARFSLERVAIRRRGGG